MEEELNRFLPHSDQESAKCGLKGLIKSSLASILVIGILMATIGVHNTQSFQYQGEERIKIIDLSHNTNLSESFTLQHVDGHGDNFRITFSSVETDLYLHHSIVSKKIGCSEKSGKIFFNEEAEIISLSRVFHNFKLVYWIGDGKKLKVKPAYVGCVHFDTGFAHFFFVTLLSNVLTMNNIGKELAYYAGNEASAVDKKPMTRSFTLSDPSKNRFIMLGDSGGEGRNFIFSSILNDINSIKGIIHVGDMSYASNTGECYSAKQGKAKEPMQSQCEWDCPVDNPSCRGRLRNNKRVYSRWKYFLQESSTIFSKTPLMTTMGNHDNDIYWFYKFRPPHKSSFPLVDLKNDVPLQVQEAYKALFASKSTKLPNKQALVSDIMRQPYFYSFTQGLIQFISIGSEDNPINPYETNRVTNGSLPYKFRKRYQDHYGKQSAQYKWLESLLSAIDRKKYPWVVVYTHRPFFHTNYHHKVCSLKGDWFGCYFRNHYSELFEKYRVNLVVSGHSHHYSRSQPILNAIDYSLSDELFDEPTVKHSELRNLQKIPNKLLNLPPLVDTKKGVVYCVIGTGGFELDGGFMQRSKPEWVGFRQGNKFGYAIIEAINHVQLSWKFVSVSSSGSHVLDEYTIRQ